MQNISSVREALMAELLTDVGELIGKLEALDASLATTIERAVANAHGNAFQTTRSNLAAFVDDQGRKLGAAGRDAANAIGYELSGQGAALIHAAQGLSTHARRQFHVLLGVALGAGIVGGLLGALLVAWITLGRPLT